MRACRMGGLFALLARVGTSRHPYNGWKVCMLGPMVGLDRKVPSPSCGPPARGGILFRLPDERFD
jgi:hypothetical protein